MQSAPSDAAHGNSSRAAKGTPSCSGSSPSSGDPGGTSSHAHRRKAADTPAVITTSPPRVRNIARAARHGACSHCRPRGKHVAAKLSFPSSSMNSARAHTRCAATRAASPPYLRRFASVRTRRRLTKSTRTPSSSATSRGGCSLLASDSCPKRASTRLRASKCSHARLTCRPSRMSGAPDCSWMRSSMLAQLLSSMYIDTACRLVQRSASSASEAPAAKPSARRCACHATTRSSVGGWAASTRCSSRRISCTSTLEKRVHLAASAALPKQHRPSTM